MTLHLDTADLQAPMPAARADSLPLSEADERERLMKEFAITFVGQQYQYSYYRYDRLADAVSYARLRRAARYSEPADPLPPARIVETPDELQHRKMIGNGITYDKGVYHFGAYRYDRLADAMRYAQVANRQ